MSDISKIEHTPQPLEPELGFGEHSQPVSYSTYKNAKIVSEIALAVLLTGLLAGGLVLGGVVIFPVLGLSLAALGLSITTLTLATAASSGVLVAGAISSVIYFNSCKSALFGVLNHINQKLDQPLALGKSSDCDAIVCEDTVESFGWKKKLIEAAQHNIVLSGNYCGGESFDEILDLIEKQLMKKSDLKVVLISSDKFITEKNKERLEMLERDHGSRFQLVESPDIYHVNPGLKKTTNHTKALAIDYGEYILLGGSGVEDKYAYAKGLGGQGEKENNDAGGMLNWFLPRGFRDQDFVFHSNVAQGVGKRVYLESVKLALRWEGMSKLKAFHSDIESAHDFEKHESVAKNLLLDETKGNSHPVVTTHIDEFHQSPKCQQNCSTKVYCTGPERTQNPFEKELIERFKQAKERIIVDHMYFHPSDGVMQALVDAANRGVKIKIVTNGYNKKSSPNGHMFFGPRNRYNYIKLREAVKPDAQDNIEVFEFKVTETTLHKKVIVCDDYVIAGSSNLGYKSLITMSDHELNFVTKNQKLADETANVALQVDAKVDATVEGKRIKGNAKKVNDFRISYSIMLKAARHRILAPLIG